MIRSSNDVEAKNPSLSLPLSAPQPGNLSQGQETQLLQSCVVSPSPPQQQQILCTLGGGTASETTYRCNNGQPPQQHVIRPAAINTTVRNAVVSNVATVVTAGTPFPATTTTVVTSTTIGHVHQQTVTTPTSLQQYILTGEHHPGAIQIPPSTVQSTTCPSSSTVHTSSNASAQQQTCTVGVSPNLARILATTQGYLHVGYSSSTTTVPITSTTSKSLQPVARTTVNHGTQSFCADEMVHGESTVSTSLTQRTCLDSQLATSVGIRCNSAPSVSGGPSCVVSQRVTFQQDRPTEDWGQVPADSLHSYTASSVYGTTVSPKPNQSQHPPSPCRTVPSGVSVPPLMTDAFHRLKVSAPNVSLSTTAISQPSASLPVTSLSNRHKRVKLEPKLPCSPETGELRNAISDHRAWEMKALREAYVERLTELFFLESGHNFVDYLGWKKRANPQLLMHLKGNPLDSDDEELSISYPPVASLLTTATTTTTTPITHSFAEVKVPAAGGTPVATSTSLPVAVTQISQLGGTPIVPEITCTSAAITSTPSSHSLAYHSEITSSALGPVSRQPSSPITPSALASSPSGSGVAPTSPTRPTRLTDSPIPTPSVPEVVSITASSAAGGRVGRPPSSTMGVASPSRFQTRQHSISAVYDSTIGSQEEIVERAKQEAHVIQRIAELRKDGLWSERRLPKVQEPQRTKAHWDYLLEEMVWLATDFSQERKWKKAAAKKCARMCQKFHLEQKLREERAEKEAEQKLKRIASIIAKEIKQFWANVEKFVEYKQQSRLDLKRKKVLDLQLSFIVDQTEKYSSWVAQGMSKSVTTGSAQNSLVSSAQMSQSSSPLQSSESGSDEDFAPPIETSDDEETIALAEEEVDVDSQRIEVELLEKESQVPLEDLLRELPPEILEKPASPVKMDSTGKDDDDNDDYDHDDRENENDSNGNDAWHHMSGKVQRRGSRVEKEVGSNDEYHVSSGENTSDDEATIDEQEVMECGVDHSEELADLKNEGEMSIEDVIKKYRGAYESDFDMSVSQSEGSISTSESEEEVDVEDSEEEDEGSEDLSDDGMQDIGIESLINPSSEAEGGTNDVNGSPRKGPGKEITDIAAAAESFKPKGYTYLTTEVATKVPFLVKHQLREYQHIGLDWLVTMYERKLNGILADEMGLGKTIQTIALMAHLACEKGNWGPHLIVVPTSVMLNWEMEFKKWCPAFKILTYYGTQKERKLKRQGWTKPNTFHVCITSYKLVIQDHQSFRRKKWKYFILDEAQNIKNFKSQRWQLLLNFQSQRRLLLTGTPLQNSLMELWSLMHFLMPSVFHSHRDFKEWFANPVSDMIEGSHEYDKELINRLHKVLRPFLLRRLKSEVEKQLPRKFEHVVMCRLSKRQRYLYDDFMSQAKTKETLATGNFMSVINVLMQLRKVCNHPNLFEVRPTVSPFQMEGICYHTASLVYRALEYDPFRQVDLLSLNLMLADLELCLTAFAAHRVKRFQTPRKLIEEIDSTPDPPPKCPAGKIKLHVRTTSSVSAQKSVASGQAPVNATVRSPLVTLAPSGTSSPGVVSVRPLMPSMQHSSSNTATLRTPSPISQSSSVSGTLPSTQTTSQQSGQSLSTYTLQLVQQQPQGSMQVAQIGASSVVTSTPITVQIQQTQQGPRLMVPSGQLTQIPAGFAQLVQTSTGQHLLLTSSSQTVLQPVNTVQNISQASTTPNRMTVTLSSVSSGTSQAAAAVSVAQLRSQASSLSTALVASNSVTVPKPILRVAPLNMATTHPVTRPASSIYTCSATTLATSSTPKVTSPISVPAVAAYETVAQSPTPVKLSEVKMFTKHASDVGEEHKPNKATPVLTPAPKSLFHLESLVEMRRQHRKERLERLSRFNTRRCEACPIYGSDLIKAVTVVDDTNSKGLPWRGMGYVHCLNAVHLRSHPKHYWNQTQELANLVYTPESLIQRLRDILTRYVFVVPSVMTPKISVHISHPSPSRSLTERMRSALLRKELSPRAVCMHAIASATTTQFPDARLIQYDCGKLQTLDRLLRKLKSEGRRVLIFTQMTRMLDVLEQFLNYHGHIYLRLDGTTRVEQRQALMERFNADLRIFCFILSTRSGGIGVNLTGADTVIFYDSDWNPTMDAQAQDRCHRIGQTRDVHIFRLVSERTVEENILKKANQKRLLGEVAIEGGNFTTAFFKKHTIQELFDVDFDSIKKDALNTIRKDLPIVKEEVSSPGDSISNIQLEHALANAEEDTDVQAAKNAKKEADLELAEFDESIPYDGDGIRDEESFKVEEELGAMMAELTPVQRYAMNFLESIQEEFSLEQLKQAEEEIEAQKKDWELGRLQALREEEERRAQLEDNDVPFTYTREDASNQMYISYSTGEQMPIWAPPTPPQDKGDVYIDYGLCFLYEPNAMPESQLPPVYVKKEHKRARVDGGLNARKHKMRKDDAVCIPRSLFDRPSATILKMRRDVKMQKMGGSAKPSSSPGYKPPAVVNKPIIDTHQDSPEWLIHEDWALLQAVQTLLDLPLTLIVVSPGHTPNWDLVADVVNTTSRIYRSPKQCKNRYESVIIPREEGKILYDTNPKKQKKSKGIYRTKNNRPMRTSQLFLQDNNSSFTTLLHQRFETIKSLATKRAPTLRHTIVNPSGRNPKHAAVLAESGISYEQPLTPVQVAVNRAERINREKLKSQVLTSEQIAVQQQQQQQRQQIQQVVGATTGQVIASPTQAQAPTVTAQAVIGLTATGQMTPQQLQSVIGRMTAVAAPNLASPAGPPSVTPGAIRAQRATVSTGPLVMQDFLGGVAQVRNVGSPTVPQAVVSMANLTPSQVQTALGAQQRVAAGTIPVSTVGMAVPTQVATVAGGKGLTMAQLQLLRTQSIYKQQRLQQVAQQQQQQQQQQVQGALQPSKASVAVTSLLTSNMASVPVNPIQQRAQAVKQTVARTMTEADLAQLLKRQHQIQQQKAAAVAAAQVAQVQVPAQSQLSSQLFTQAQLHQLQQQTAAGQGSLATLVKTVTTPTSLGNASPNSVTIPVSAVGMAGVNINVSLPQVKATIGAPKTTLVTPQQQQQLQQLKLQQQLIQQRKLQQQQQQQQKLAQVQAGAQLGTVQIVQPAQHRKALPATVTVQQLIKQVPQQTLQHLAQQVSGGATAVVTQAAGVQALAHTMLTKAGQASLGSPTTVTAALHAAAVQGQQTLHTRVIPVGQNLAGVAASQLSQQTSSALTQTIQVVTTAAAPQGHLRASTSNVTIDASGRPQAIVSHAGVLNPSAVSSFPGATTIPMGLATGIKVTSSGSQQPVGLTIQQQQQQQQQQLTRDAGGQQPPTK